MTEGSRSEKFSDNLREEQEHNSLEAANILDQIKNAVHCATSLVLNFAKVKIDSEK